jgi:hypothetical protein
MFSNINYNDYFVDGAQGVLGAINSTDATDLTMLQTATGQDANSVSVDPLFTSPTDLHLTAASPVQNIGTPIPGIFNDFDDNLRSATTPDLGADELVAPSAASVSLGGRILTADGRGIRNVLVTLTESNGTSRTVISGPFGNYRFTNVAPGQAVIISAKGKRYVFEDPTRVIQVNEELTEINFVSVQLPVTKDDQ